MLGEITDEEFVEAIRALAARGMVEITRDIDTDIVGRGADRSRMACARGAVMKVPGPAC